MDVRILVLYDNAGAQITAMAQAVGEGVGSVEGVEAILKDLTSATPDDLLDAHGIVLGSPNWNGMTGRLKLWLDDVSGMGQEGLLEGKIGGAFTAGWGRSSGTEFTLLTLLHWMLSGGMIIVGLPWTDRMAVSGSYYGATVHGSITRDDLEQARALGSRMARVARYLKDGGMESIV
ncbi:MAG: Multimeric flavodoxin WrbA-like protein [Dehalococcoidia bacterium]|nr:Multimeric flavodoxin WrbA-like protein [Dehalococcoidia bacterium]